MSVPSRIRRLDALIDRWHDEAVPVVSPSLSDALDAFVSERDRAAEQGAAFDPRSLMIAGLQRAIAASWSVDTASNRLEAVSNGLVPVSGHDEMHFLEQERALIDLLAGRLSAVDEEGVDDLIEALEGFELDKVADYGIDYGMRRTIVLVLPLIRALQQLQDARTSPGDILEMHRPDPGGPVEP